VTVPALRAARSLEQCFVFGWRRLRFLAAMYSNTVGGIFGYNGV
jgi:hypothetical protein